jgi:hypothetical protein
MRVTGDASLNGNVFLRNMFFTRTNVTTTTFTATFPLSQLYVVSFNGAVTFNLPALPANVTSEIFTIRKTGSIGASTITLTPPTSIIFASGATAVSASAQVCVTTATTGQFCFSNGQYFVI